MRGEPSRGLLDTSQAIFAALPAWPAALSAISSWALRQPKIAPRGSLAPAKRPGDLSKRQEAAPRNEHVGAPDGAQYYGTHEHRTERGLGDGPPQSAQPRLGGRDAARAVAAGGPTFRKGRLRAHPTLADVAA